MHVDPYPTTDAPPATPITVKSPLLVRVITVVQCGFQVGVAWLGIVVGHEEVDELV